MADVAIENLGSGVFPQNNPAITIDTGGVAERIVARSTLAPAITCTMLSGGILRESVCLNEAPSGTALGASLLTSSGTCTVTVRDVTALATGSGSFGASFNYFGSEASPTIFNVSLKGVIARGQLKDVRAAGLRNGPTGVGATTSIILDHSDYASTDTLVTGGGSASVTPAGSGTNIADGAALCRRWLPPARYLADPRQRRGRRLERDRRPRRAAADDRLGARHRRRRARARDLAEHQLLARNAGRER